MRIHVTGNSGAGKTTFARQLGEALELPVFGLDDIVWQPGWVQTPPEERAALEEDLINQNSWVIEGVSVRVRRAADIIVFLDVPRPLAYARALRRNLPYLFKSRPGLPENCPEWKLTLQHAALVWQFSARTRPTILRDMQSHTGKSFVVRNDKSRAQVLAQLAGL